MKAVRATSMALLVLFPVVARAQDAVLPAPLGPIAAAVRAGEDEAGLAALRALEPAVRAAPAARYLEGRLAERLGDLPSAVDAYAAVAAVASSGPHLPDAIVRDAQMRRARLLARSGRCAEAEALLASSARSGALERALAAECALRRGDLRRAQELLAAAAADDAPDVDTFALRFALAQAQARAGATDRASATLRQLLVERPDHPEADAAEEALATLVGGPVDWTLEERLDRAERLSAALSHERARREVERAPRPTDRAALRRWLHVRGMVLFRSRRAYAEAARVLAEAARIEGPTTLDDAFFAARALSRSGADPAAIDAYRALARRAGGTARGAQAEYLAAWLEMRLGRRGGARAMERFVRSPRAARVPGLAREGRWLLALEAFERGEHARAAEMFAAYASLDGDPMVRGRGSYWRARALELAGDRAAAIAAYRAAIRLWPLHWYALLARERLRALGEEPGPPFALPARSDAGTAAPLGLPEDVVFLRALGLDRDARAALRQHERALRARGIRALVTEYARLGDHARAYRLTAAAPELRRPPRGAERWAWEAAYPRAYEDAVLEAARSRALPPEMLWAIMRQESGYDPEAVSSAGAIGLMQLMPSSAARLARAAGVPFRDDMLFEPAWNVRLAAAYIAVLRDAYGVPLCFAAYNAGAHRLEQWLAERGEMDLDLFVERIPFEQTRNYVRRVSSHYARYLFLADPEAGWPALDLPMRVAPRAAR